MKRKFCTVYRKSQYYYVLIWEGEVALKFLRVRHRTDVEALRRLYHV